MANVPAPKTPQRTAWVKQLLSTTTQRDAAKRSGINQPTLSRQIAHNHIPIETILALARGLNYSEIQALIESGVIAQTAIDDYLNQQDS